MNIWHPERWLKQMRDTQISTMLMKRLMISNRWGKDQGQGTLSGRCCRTIVDLLVMKK